MVGLGLLMVWFGSKRVETLSFIGVGGGVVAILMWGSMLMFDLGTGSWYWKQVGRGFDKDH